MKTHEEQRAFFDDHWPRLKEALETGGAAAAVSFISGFEDELERRVLHMFARQGVVFGDWKGKSLDAIITVAEAGVEEFLRQAEAASDEEGRRARIDGANVISYNLAGDLADCWPGDDAPRERRHHQVGLAAAERCIRFREELDKPDAPRSMAWWAKGVHQLDLDDGPGAVESFSRALEYGRPAAAADGGPSSISPGSGFLAIVGAGYLGLARCKAGDAAGRDLYAEAIAAFRGQLEDADRKGDAQFGIDQLEKVRGKHMP